jgi:hypothetical protein
VQLQILSSLVKLYLEKPDSTRDQLQFILSEATKDGVNPDIKNRALTYWRLLSADSTNSVAKSIIRFGKEVVLHSGVRFEGAVLSELIRNMGSVAGVLHIVPSDFGSRVKYVPEADEDYGEDNHELRDWTRVKFNSNSPVDLFMDFDCVNVYLRIVNKDMSPISQLAFAMNKNVIGLTLQQLPKFPDVVEFGDVIEVAVPAKPDPTQAGNEAAMELQVAVKSNTGQYFGVTRIPIEVALTPARQMSQNEFRTNFGNYQATLSVNVKTAELATEEQLKERQIFVVGKSGDKMYVSFAFGGGAKYLAELAPSADGFTVALKGSTPVLLQHIAKNAIQLFAKK